MWISIDDTSLLLHGGQPEQRRSVGTITFSDDGVPISLYPVALGVGEANRNLGMVVALKMTVSYAVDTDLLL